MKNFIIIRFSHSYGFRVIPARPYKPRDKANVERQLGIIQQQFFSQVRDEVFTSIHVLNQQLNEYMNNFLRMEMRGSSFSRHDRFQYEKEYLLPLPHNTFCIPEYRIVKVHPDCHIQYNRNFLFCSSQVCGERVLKPGLFEESLSYFDKEGESITSHILFRGRDKFITKQSHYPEEKVALMSFSVQTALERSRQIGPKMLKLTQTLLSGSHPFRYLRRVQGILAPYDPKRSNNKFDRADMEYAASQCLEHNQHKHSFFMDFAKNSKSLQFQAKARVQAVPKRDESFVYLDKSHKVQLTEKGE